MLGLKLAVAVGKWELGHDFRERIQQTLVQHDIRYENMEIISKESIWISKIGIVRMTNAHRIDKSQVNLELLTWD